VVKLPVFVGFHPLLVLAARRIIQLLGGVTAGLAVMIVLASWRLSSGPISLSPLDPYVEAALNPPGAHQRIQIGHTVLTWAGWERTLDLRVLDVAVTQPDGQVLATVPELSLSLSARGLLAGMIAPHSLELIGPRLKAQRDGNGRFSIGFELEGADGSLLPLVIAAFGRVEGPLSYLQLVRVSDATVRFEDRRSGLAWQTPHASLALERTEDGVVANAEFDIAVGERRARVSAVAQHSIPAKHTELAFTFDAPDALLLSDLEPALANIARFETPVRGTVSSSVGSDGRFGEIAFNVTGGAGAVVVAGPGGQQALDVAALHALGRYDADRQRLSFDHMEAQFGRNASVRLPPVGHPMPIRRATLRGSFDLGAGTIQLPAFELDLDGPAAEGAITVMGLGSATPELQVIGSIRNVPIDQLSNYWIEGWGTKARNWSLRSLSGGMLREITVNANLGFAGGHLTVNAVNGTLTADAGVLRPVGDLPAISDLWTTAHFTAERMDFKFSEGASGKLRLQAGTVALIDINSSHPRAEIAAKVTGPLADAVNYVDHKPLRFASALALAPERLSGNVDVDIVLGFPLLADLPVGSVETAAKARLRGVTLARAVGGLDLADGNFEMTASNKEMRISGTASLGGIAATLAWRERVDGTGEDRASYSFAGRVDRAQWDRIGVPLPLWMTEKVTGPTGVSVVYTVARRGPNRLNANLDLTASALSWPALNWGKAAGAPASATVEATIVEGQAAKLDRLRFAAGSDVIEGSAVFGPDGRPNKIGLSRLKLGRTDVAVVAQRTDDHWDADVQGVALDLGDALDEVLADGAIDSDAPPITMTMTLDDVLLADDRSVANVAGLLDRRAGRIHRANLTGHLKGGEQVVITVEPTESHRRFTLRSDNAGEALAALGVYENMIGGKLLIEAEIDDRQPMSPIEGRLSVSEYRIIRAPILARLLSIMAVTGIPESLQGQGLRFSVLEVPFHHLGGVLTLKDARASGPSLGFTAKGRMFLNADVLELEGTVVPAYLLNSILGHIPLLGNLLTGGERGGGVFAANYSMSGPFADPAVTINPLSALTPGILRNLFGIFRDGDSAIAPPDALTAPGVGAAGN